MNIFIIGIAGGTGSRVAKLLAARNDIVSGLYRSPEQLAVLHEIGASGTLGDVATISAQELALAATGADALVFTAGAGSLDDDSMIDKVDGAGVSKLSQPPTWQAYHGFFWFRYSRKHGARGICQAVLNTTWQLKKERTWTSFIVNLIG